MVQPIPLTPAVEISQTSSQAATPDSANSFQNHLDHALNSQANGQPVVTVQPRMKNKDASRAEAGTAPAAGTTPPVSPDEQPAPHKGLQSPAENHTETESQSGQSTGSPVQTAGITASDSSDPGCQANGASPAFSPQVELANPAAGILSTQTAPTISDQTKFSDTAAQSPFFGPVISTSDGQGPIKSGTDAQVASTPETTSSNDPLTSKGLGEFSPLTQQAAEKIFANVAGTSPDGNSATDGNPATAVQPDIGKGALGASAILNSLQAEKASLQAFDGWVESKNPGNSAEQLSPNSHSLMDALNGESQAGNKIEANSQKTGSETGQNSNGQPDPKATSDSALTSGPVSSGSKDNSFLGDLSSRHPNLAVAMNVTPATTQAASSQTETPATATPLPANANSLQSPNPTAGNGTGNAPNTAAFTKAMSTDLPAYAPAPANPVNTAGLTQNGGKVEMRVDLTTEALGSVQLHAVMQDGRLGASIGVENRDAHTLLTSELPALQQSLLDKNVQIEHLSVLDSSLSGSGQKGGDGSQAGCQTSEQQAPAIWRTWSGQGSSLPEHSNISNEISPAGSGRLSVRA